MKTILVCFCVSLLVVAGCQNPTTPPATQPANAADRVIATVSGMDLTYGQVSRPLMDMYGLETLIYTVQLQMAREEAKAMHLTVTREEVKAEVVPSVHLIFPELQKISEEQAWAKVQEYLSAGPVAVDLWLETNAYFRKILDSKIRAAMNEERLKDAFDALYGAKVLVRHIRVNNATRAAQILGQIKDGLSFEEAARQFSQDRLTAQNGGLIQPAFSYAQCKPGRLRDACFLALKEGEVADEIVESSEGFHIIKLEKKIPADPRIANFNDPDLRESARKWAIDRIMAEVMQAKREQYRDLTRKYLAISDPTLAAQYAALLDRYRAHEKEKGDLLKQYEAEKAAAATQAATHPSTATAPVNGAPRPTTLKDWTRPPTRPTSSAGAAALTTAPRPPATMPGK